MILSPFSESFKSNMFRGENENQAALREKTMPEAQRLAKRR
jgi:hypothetical protein